MVAEAILEQWDFVYSTWEGWVEELVLLWIYFVMEGVVEAALFCLRLMSAFQ